MLNLKGRSPRLVAGLAASVVVAAGVVLAGAGRSGAVALPPGPTVNFTAVLGSVTDSQTGGKDQLKIWWTYAYTVDSPDSKMDVKADGCAFTITITDILTLTDTVFFNVGANDPRWVKIDNVYSIGMTDVTGSWSVQVNDVAHTLTVSLQNCTFPFGNLANTPAGLWGATNNPIPVHIEFQSGNDTNYTFATDTNFRNTGGYNTATNWGKLVKQ